MIDYDNLLIRSVLVPLVSGFVWQIIRALWLMIDLKEPFFSGFFCRPEVSTKTARNVVHARLGVVHCIVVLALTVTAMYEHRHETWDQWNYQRTTDLDEGAFVKTIWPLWVTTGYFISDCVYLSDFPAYYWHHLAAIFELCSLASDPNCSMVIAQGIFIAESGGILLSIYLQFKSIYTYFVFILCYGFSRFVLLPVCIYQMLFSAFRSDITCNFYLACLANSMSIMLMFINWNFWWTHVRKFVSKLKGEDPKGDKKTEQNGSGSNGEDKGKVVRGSRKKAE